MQIIINDLPAVIKQGTSFDYVAENRLFSDADDYTLTITFPLRGCPENLAIFGHINRADIVADKVIFDCEIIARNLYKSGTIVVTEITDTEVKTQFLEGRSEGNFTTTLDAIYINDLTLGTATQVAALPPSALWRQGATVPAYVALPWVNDSTGALQNEVVLDSSTQEWRWAAGVKKLSRQPYLLYLTRLICQAVGYTSNFKEWGGHPGYRHLLVCNALPVAWELADYARALPHWTVEEYFARLELLLDGEFDFDHRAHTVTFAFTQPRVAAIPPVYLDRVTSDHSLQITQGDTKCAYRGGKRLTFRDSAHDGWKYLSCDWFIKQMKSRIERYPDLDTLIAQNRHLRANTTPDIATWPDGNRLLYAEKENAYFILQIYQYIPDLRGLTQVGWTYKSRLRPINLFGSNITIPDDSSEGEELDFVPVRIDQTDTRGPVIFLTPQGYQEPEAPDPDRPYTDTPMLTALKQGETTQATEYYDRIYLGWWNGIPINPTRQAAPIPDDIIVDDDWSYTLRPSPLPIRSRRRAGYNIDPARRRTFKFLADTIPTPRALYIIEGKRYLCEKITATFTTSGMSQLLKGDFYPVTD